MEWKDIFGRLLFKLTSGRFIFTIVVAGVYAYLAINQLLEDDRINEITLVVLYAYFSRPRVNGYNSSDKIDEIKESKKQ